MKMLTQSLLREMFDYRDGSLIRRSGRWCGRPIGSPDKDGYLRTALFGRGYQIHRLVYLWHHGEFPSEQTDHIDRDKTNNRIENLRAVTHQQNTFNRGARGTTKHRGKWQAIIKVSGIVHYLGLFDTEAAAHEAYLAAKKTLHVIGSDSLAA